MTCSCPTWTAGWTPATLVTYLVAGDPVTGTPLDLTPATHTVVLGLADGSTVLVGGHGSADTFVSVSAGCHGHRTKSNCPPYPHAGKAA